MILLIIFGILFIAGVVLIILGKKGVCRSYDGDDTLTVVGVITGLTGMFSLFLCGVAMICSHSKVYTNQVRIEYQQRIESINNTRLALENRIDSTTVTFLDINTYNETVREFKTDIEQHQLSLNSPWIGCFCCPAYNEFDANAVSYLYLE